MCALKLHTRYLYTQYRQAEVNNSQLLFILATCNVNNVVKMQCMYQ